MTGKATAWQTTLRYHALIHSYKVQLFTHFVLRLILFIRNAVQLVVHIGGGVRLLVSEERVEKFRGWNNYEPAIKGC